MSIMHCHKHGQQYDSDLGECPDCEHEEGPDALIADLMNGEERLSNVVEDLRRQMLAFADVVKRLAFEMPPPNEYTPKFVQMALEAERTAREAGRQLPEERQRFGEGVASYATTAAAPLERERGDDPRRKNTPRIELGNPGDGNPPATGSAER